MAGYISKDIAVITEPKRVTLAARPNFVQFARKAAGKTFLELNLTILAPTTLTGLLRLTTPSGVVYDFKPTTVKAEVTNGVFYVSAIASETAENIRGALLANDWVAANFAVAIPANWAGAAPVNGSIINIKSKGAGVDYNVTLTAPNNTGGAAYTIAWVQATSLSNDSISGEAGTVEVELDIYTGPAVFLGADDKPTTPAKLGTFATSLQKTYAGAPVWFDLNALFNRYGGFNRPSGAYGWFNTGTASVYRFVAKIKGPTSFAFYYSNALWALNGYGPLTDTVDLADYVYLDKPIKLLTNKPKATYVRGQKEYLNFLFESPENEIPLNLAGGYVIYNTGLYDPASIGGTYFGTVGYIDIAPNTSYRYTGAFLYFAGVAYYDVNKVYISGTNVQGLGGVLTPPANAKFFRISSYSENGVHTGAQVFAGPAFALRVAYRAYATGGAYLGVIYSHDVTRAALSVVNTCALNMDAVLDAYPLAGEIKVALARGTAPVSNDMEYQVRPDCLHTLRPFTFLNRLGGWDTFNFDAPVLDEIKPASDTFNKTVAPGFTRGDSIETVYATTLENTLTVEGTPVSDKVADWLKELAAARVILDGSGNYVVMDEFTLRKSSASFNMQIPTIKYHLSETYTND